MLTNRVYSLVNKLPITLTLPQNRHTVVFFFVFDTALNYSVEIVCLSLQVVVHCANEILLAS